MGVTVQRIDLCGNGTYDDTYPGATGFWYDPADKIMYVQVDDRYVDGVFQRESNIAAYPKGSYVRAFLDPAPLVQTESEFYDFEEEGEEEVPLVTDANIDRYEEENGQ